MKHILILLTLVFSMASVDAQTTNAETQTTNAEQDFQTSLDYYEEEDYEQAFIWVKKAAEQGHAKAQHNLGVMYENGLGVLQDGKQAIHWYKKAAEKGNANTQYSVGYMYQQGLGVTQDYEQALVWYIVAAEQGHAGAKNTRDVLSNAVSFYGTIRAANKARKCIDSKYQDCTFSWYNRY